MTVKTKMIKDFAEIGFTRLGNATKNLTEEQLDWKSCDHANTIRSILTHMSEELNVYLPKFLDTAPPKDWPKDYSTNKSYKLPKLMKDIESGKRKLYAGLNKLTNEKIDEEIEAWAGKKPRSYYIMLMTTEIIHHEGQIAAILGIDKRIKGIK